MSWGSHYWPVFLTISAIWLLLGFGIPELIAIFTQASTHLDNTLSHYSQTELHVTGSITRHDVAWYLSLLCWVMVTTVLTWHIWFMFGG